MGKEKVVLCLSKEEARELRGVLGKTLEILGKGDLNLKEEGLRILESWGRIVFIVSGEGKRIGVELTERWERERASDS